MADIAFRVFLRALGPDDHKTSVVWRQDEEIWGMVVGRRRFVSEESERRWVAREDDDVRLAICLEPDGRHIGYVMLGGVDFFNRQARSSLIIGEKSCWGEGYGTEALLLLLRHAFLDLGLERIEARALTTNSASVRLHEKCGFRIEGTLRRAAFKEGQFCDLAVMACLREGFLSAWMLALQRGVGGRA